ncbi:hypothetical protein [Neobacillus sp. D3-1R]
MEAFLEFSKEVLKGIVREVSAYITRQALLKTRKPPRSRKQKGGSHSK